MESQRILLGLVLASAVGTALAQSGGSLRWRSGPLGLQAGQDEFRFACSSVASPCEGANSVRLYESPRAPRTVSMLVGWQQRPALGLARPQTLKVSVLGRAGIAPDLGVYGRFGTTVGRPVASLVPTADAGGMSYGVGFKWDFSPRGSALLGWDSYDLRTGLGDARDVRAASLGLQWRY